MPENFGRYELHELLGRGGMGEVYRAVDTVRDRSVALKLLAKHLAADESFKVRFRRESQLVARLNAPHIIPIHDFGEIEGQLFIDMRLVEGRDLGSVLGDGGLAVDTGLKIITQVASALEAAHRSGLVHRDVKPSNVLLADWTDTAGVDPFAYLVDFGIASSVAQGATLTAASGTVGTVDYMAPERIAGAPGDSRADVYALGCVLYETLAGRKPFEGETLAIMYAHVNKPVPVLTDAVPDAPEALNAVIAMAMAKEPDERYSSASEFALAARAALSNETRSSLRARADAGYRLQESPTVAGTRRRAFRPAPPGESVHASAPTRTPLPPHPSGPILAPPPSPPPAGAAKRKWLVLGTGALVAVATAITLVVVFANDSGRQPTLGISGVSTTRSVSSSSPALVLRTGGPSTPTTSWDHFGSFTKLVGTRAGDTAGAFKHATCQLDAPTTDDLAHGVLDQVRCAYPGGIVFSFVGRHANQAQVKFVIQKAVPRMIAPIAVGGRLVGIRADTKNAGVITWMCGLPNYLVQFFSKDGIAVPPSALISRYSSNVTFPDVVLPECKDDLSGTTDNSPLLVAGPTALPTVTVAAPGPLATFCATTPAKYETVNQTPVDSVSC